MTEEKEWLRQIEAERGRRQRENELLEAGYTYPLFLDQMEPAKAEAYKREYRDLVYTIRRDIFPHIDERNFDRHRR